MTLPFGALLALHLTCAFGATLVFWITAFASKGGPRHRASGRWFSRLIYVAAITGGVLAVAELAVPQLVRLSPPTGAALASARQTMWFVLYVLLIIVAPVHHGLAVVAAGPVPAQMRSVFHGWLNVAALIGSACLLPAAVMWNQWMFLIVAPIGAIVGLRNLSYASRRAASPLDWQREHLTSLLTAGITLHTAFLVFGTSRTLGWVLTGWQSLLPWTVPAVVGLVAILWWRRKGLLFSKTSS